MCWDKTGKAPIGVRWVDINKGDKIHPEYRSRLVAKEIKKDTSSAPDMFAATPPIEALRFIMSCAASQTGSNRKNIITSNHFRRAYFYAPSVRRVFIKIPEEDYEEGDENMCAELDFSMYGTRDAAHNWEIEYTNFLTNIGFKSGSASPCHFHHPSRLIDLVVHGYANPKDAENQAEFFAYPVRVGKFRQITYSQKATTTDLLPLVQVETSCSKHGIVGVIKIVGLV